MSNIGPLTTTFTGPSDCSWWSIQIVTATTAKFASSFYNYVGSIWPSPLRCFPSGYPFANSERFSNFYSPGVCPSAWLPFGVTSNLPDPAETTAICCPPGFNVSHPQQIYNSYFPCTAFQTKNITVTAVIILGSIDIANRPYGDNTAGLITSTNFRPGYGEWAVFGVQIRYRSGDFDSNGHAISTSAASQNVSGTSPNSTIAPNNDTRALSNGAIIGLGIGVPLVVLILATILAFVCIRRRHQRANKVSHVNRDSYMEFKPELPGSRFGEFGRGRYAGKAELGANVSHAELDVIASHAELPDRNTSVSSLTHSRNVGATSVYTEKVLSTPKRPGIKISRKPLPPNSQLPTYRGNISDEHHSAISEVYSPITAAERTESLYI